MYWKWGSLLQEKCLWPSGTFFQKGRHTAKYLIVYSLNRDCLWYTVDGKVIIFVVVWLRLQTGWCFRLIWRPLWALKLEEEINKLISTIHLGDGFSMDFGFYWISFLPGYNYFMEDFGGIFRGKIRKKRTWVNSKSTIMVDKNSQKNKTKD